MHHHLGGLIMVVVSALSLLDLVTSITELISHELSLQDLDTVQQ